MPPESNSVATQVLHAPRAQALSDRLGLRRGMSFCRGCITVVLLYTTWNFKVISSMPRLLDLDKWWAPLLFPETIVLLLALLVAFEAGMCRWPRSLDWLFSCSLALYIVGLVVSTASNEINGHYLMRVVVLQYVIPLIFFFLLLRSVESLEQLLTCTRAFVTGGCLLFIVATLVYFTSFYALPYKQPPWPPAAWVIYNRMSFVLVHNEPYMLYDNVTFGNFLNISQLLVTLLPVALGWLFTAPTRRDRIISTLATTVFLLHLFLVYSRGAIVATIVTLATANFVFWRSRHELRWLVFALTIFFIVLTFGSLDALQYWWAQITLTLDSTMMARVQAVGVILDLEFLKDNALSGLGYGNYGKLLGMIPGSGTHNMFINSFVNTGVIGVLGLVGLTLWTTRNFMLHVDWRSGGWSGGRKGDVGPFFILAFLNIVIVGTLSLYEFEYLGTSTGAVIFWFLMASSVKLKMIPAPSHV